MFCIMRGYNISVLTDRQKERPGVERVSHWWGHEWQQKGIDKGDWLIDQNDESNNWLINW